jgi:hypothetical protein
MDQQRTIADLQSEMAVLRQELRQAKSQFRHWGLMGIGLVVVGLGIHACAKPPPKTLRLERIEIVDGKGKIRATLAGPVLELRDEYEKVRAEFKLTESGPEILFRDGKSVVRSSFGLLGRNPVLLMGRVDGEPELQMTVGETGSGLWLRDTTGDTKAELSVTSRGTSLVMREADTIKIEEEWPNPLAPDQ